VGQLTSAALSYGGCRMAGGYFGIRYSCLFNLASVIAGTFTPLFLRTMVYYFAVLMLMLVLGPIEDY